MTLDAQQRLAMVEPHIVMSLAGRIAERRFPCEPRMGTARHEAGHVVIGHALGLRVIEATIVPSPGVLGSAIVTPDMSAPIPATAAEGRLANQSFGSSASDRRKAVAAISGALDSPGWREVRRHVRRLQEQARALVEAHWFEIMYLAVELYHRDWMNGHDIVADIKETRAWRVKFEADLAASITVTQ